jgi:hypothetical protein
VKECQALAGEESLFQGVFILISMEAFLVILRLSTWATGSFQDRLYHSLGQFKDQGYAHKLKECICSLPRQDLVEFLYTEILSF